MTDINTSTFRKQLDSLQAKKEAITRCSSRKPGKYVINTLLNAIKEATQMLEQLTIPASLEAERSKTLLLINEAQTQINREYTASPPSYSMVETISQPMNDQVNRIREALRNFDSQGLTWINRSTA